MPIQPYLFFEGRCDEAIEFYRRAIKAEVVNLLRYKDGPQGACPDGTVPPPDKVMHAHLQIGDAVVLASDGACRGEAKFQGFGLTLTATNDSQAERFFTTLSDGGRVEAPLSKTFFASSFGMVRDRFGILWMVMAGSQ